MDNIISWLDRNADTVEASYSDCFYGVYSGHKVRFNGGSERLDVGFKDFDRWANSTAYSVNIDRNKSIPLQMNLAVVEARKNNSRPLWYETKDVINLIFSGTELNQNV